MKPNWKAVGAAVLLSTLFGLGCGDTYRPVATPIIQPGGDPNFSDIVTSVNTNPVTTSPGSVTEINVSGDINIANKDMGVGPTFGALDSSRNLIFTVQPDQHNLTVTFVTAFVLTTITMDEGTHPVFVAPGNGVMYTANTGTNCNGTGSVSIVDAVQLSVRNSLCVSSDPEFIIQNSNVRNVVVLDKANSQVWFIDQTTNTLAPVSPISLPGGSAPVAATFSLSGEQVFILNQASHTITTMDATTGAIIGSPVSTAGTEPVSITLDRHFNRLWVVNKGSNSVSIFDANNLATPPTVVPVGPAPNSIAFNPDNSRAWVANTGSNTITEIRVNSLSFQPRTIQVAPAGSLVTSVAASRTGEKVYASSVEPTNMNNGIAIMKTVDDTLVSPAPAYITIKPTQQDPACNPATAQCPLQIPIQLLSR